VHKSTGFEPSATSSSRRPDIITPADGAPLTPAQHELLRDCLPFYENLRRKAIGVHPLNPGCSVLPVHLLHLPFTDRAEAAAAAGQEQDGPAGKTKTVVDHGIRLRADRLTDDRNANLLAYVPVPALCPCVCSSLSPFPH